MLTGSCSRGDVAAFIFEHTTARAVFIQTQLEQSQAETSEARSQLKQAEERCKALAQQGECDAQFIEMVMMMTVKLLISFLL